jgi:ATP-dependent Zn protease
MGGQTTTSDKDLTNHNKEQLLKLMQVRLSGRAGEEIFFDQSSTRSTEDLTMANRIGMFYLRKMGMKDESVFVSADMGELSEIFNFEIESENRLLLKTAYGEAKDLIRGYKGTIENLARALMAKETLTKEEIEGVTNIRR